MSAAHNSLLLEIEELEDDRDRYAAMLARIEAANQELIPLHVVKRLSACEHPVKVWREYRELSVDELAARSKVDAVAVAAFENGDERVRIMDVAAIARVLNVSLESLVPWTEEGEPDRSRD